MTTTYVITPADASGHMHATSYLTREAAVAASTPSDYVVGDEGDLRWSGQVLVDVFNALTNSGLKKFESRDVGIKRIMSILPVVAKEAPAITQEDNIMALTEEQKAAKKQEREANAAAKKQEAAAAKAAKKQEAEQAKAAKKQEAEQARAAKKQEREAAKAARQAARATANGNGTTRQRFADSSRIQLLVTENPKKHGAAAGRFPLYRDGMTVKQALEAGILRADLSWDTKKNFIAIEPAS